MATLFMVATPIGNLADLSPRAAKTLAEVEVVAAESVNRARKLLSHLGVSGKQVVSSRESNRSRSAAGIVGHLNAGRDVAFLSDAGTPGVSDPGSLVVRQALAAGHAVSPLPGPSALAAALSVSGLDAGPVVFLGFAPAKTGPRQRLFSQAGQTGWPIALFEAPHRLSATVADLLAALGDRGVVLARELSKIHEQVWHTTLAGLLARCDNEEFKGEICLVVGPGGPAQASPELVEQRIREELAAAEDPPGRLAARLAAELGMSRGRIYDRLMSIRAEEDHD